MSDWRLNGQEEYLSNITLYKVTFPEFWQTAYREKNAFFEKIATYAKEVVEKTKEGIEYLEGDKIQHFWHEHCEFCWEKALTDKVSTFYCTEDMYYWICEECFRDFCGQFHWQVRPAEELMGATCHHMKLNPQPFTMIKSGQKTIELRLWDEKRQKIKVGDKIVFTNNAADETLEAIVEKLHRFDNFTQLYQSLPLLECGYTPEDVDRADPVDMEAYYSAQEQEKYGVVGIEISLLA